MELESLFGFNLQTGSFIVVFLHIIGSIPFLVAGERLITDYLLFIIIIPVNVFAIYGILNVRNNRLKILNFRPNFSTFNIIIPEKAELFMASNDSSGIRCYNTSYHRRYYSYSIDYLQRSSTTRNVC